jgi:hypothetical protein
LQYPEVIDVAGKTKAYTVRLTEAEAESFEKKAYEARKRPTSFAQEILRGYLAHHTEAKENARHEEILEKLSALERSVLLHHQGSSAAFECLLSPQFDSEAEAQAWVRKYVWRRS